MGCQRETLLPCLRSRHRAQIDCSISQAEDPDRNIISVGAGRFHCFEIWFQPSFTGKEACGINDTSFHSNMKCHVYIRKDLYDNVVVSSGTTIFQGMVERMANELTALAPFTMSSRLLLRFSMDWRTDLVYELADGNIVAVTPNISAAWKYCSSQVSLAKKPADPRHLFFRSNMKRDVHIRKELCDVVLSSGTTMFREILERITNELTALASFTTKIKVIASIRYGLEDFFCLLSASSRCGPRRASRRIPPLTVHSCVCTATTNKKTAGTAAA